MYTEKLPGFEPLGTPAAVNLTSAAVHTFSRIALTKVQVRRIALVVTTATVSTGNIVVAFKKRPTPGSSASEVVIGTITIPTAIAVGKVYYKDVTPVSLSAGDQLVYEVTTAAAGGGAAGAAVAAQECDLIPEAPANESDMVASS